MKGDLPSSLEHDDGLSKGVQGNPTLGQRRDVNICVETARTLAELDGKLPGSDGAIRVGGYRIERRG